MRVIEFDPVKERDTASLAGDAVVVSAPCEDADEPNTFVVYWRYLAARSAGVVPSRVASSTAASAASRSGSTPRMRSVLTSAPPRPAAAEPRPRHPRRPR